MVVRLGLIGLGLGVAGVAVYRLAKSRRAEVSGLAREAAQNLSKKQRKARDTGKRLHDDIVQARHGKDLVNGKKHRNRVRSGVR